MTLKVKNKKSSLPKEDESEVAETSEVQNSVTGTNKKKKSRRSKKKFIPKVESEKDETPQVQEIKSKKKKRKFPKVEKETDVDVNLAKKQKKTQSTSEKKDGKNLSIEKPISQTIEQSKKKGKVNTEETESRTIFIGNLPVNFKEKTLKKLLKEYGEIESFRIRGAIPECEKITKKVAVNKKMFSKDQQSLVAFVVFKSKQDANNALNLNGKLFGENHLRVTLPSDKSFDKNKGIFVGNLQYKVTDDELWDFFKNCGEILSVRIIKDKATGLCKGFGYVNFKSEDAVEFALKLDQEKLQDREIRIQRLFSVGKLEKLKRKKQSTVVNKNNSFANKKFKSNNKAKPTNEKPGFKFKKKGVNKVQAKKKVLAVKLLAKPKKKQESVNL